MPYWFRLLQTETLPQNASRRRSTCSCSEVVGIRLHQHRHVQARRASARRPRPSRRRSSAGRRGRRRSRSRCRRNRSAQAFACCQVSTAPSFVSSSPSRTHSMPSDSHRASTSRRASDTSASGKKSRLPMTTPSVGLAMHGLLYFAGEDAELVGVGRRDELAVDRLLLGLSRRSLRDRARAPGRRPAWRCRPPAAGPSP